MQNNNFDNSDNLTFFERIANIAQLKIAEQNKLVDQQLEASSMDYLLSMDANSAAEKLIAEIKDLNHRERAMKQLEAKRAKDAKDYELKKTSIASSVVSGQEPCIGLIYGKPCPRSAEPEERYGFMCKDCYKNEQRRKRKNLTPEQLFALKHENKNRKRERDAAANMEKQAHIEHERQKRHDKKRVRQMLMAPVQQNQPRVQPIREVVRPQVMMTVQDPASTTRLPKPDSSEEAWDMDKDLLEKNFEGQEKDQMEQVQAEANDEENPGDDMEISDGEDSGDEAVERINNAKVSPEFSDCAFCTMSITEGDSAVCPKCERAVHAGCLIYHKC